MTKVLLLPLILLGCFFTTTGVAQKPFTNCAAAFLDDKIIVDQYTDQGKCKLPMAATGTLTVCTASLSPEKSYPTGKIQFKVAIRDKNTKTLMMYSDKTYTQVPIRAVMSKCKKGDFIVLMTLKDEYALPHNEILVE